MKIPNIFQVAVEWLSPSPRSNNKPAHGKVALPPGTKPALYQADAADSAGLGPQAPEQQESIAEVTVRPSLEPQASGLYYGNGVELLESTAAVSRAPPHLEDISPAPLPPAAHTLTGHKRVSPSNLLCSGVAPHWKRSRESFTPSPGGRFGSAYRPGTFQPSVHRPYQHTYSYQPAISTVTSFALLCSTAALREVPEACLELRKEELEDETDFIKDVLQVRYNRKAKYREEEAAQREMQKQKREMQQQLGLSSEEADLAELNMYRSRLRSRWEEEDEEEPEQPALEPLATAAHNAMKHDAEEAARYAEKLVSGLTLTVQKARISLAAEESRQSMAYAGRKAEQIEREVEENRLRRIQFARELEARRQVDEEEEEEEEEEEDGPVELMSSDEEEEVAEEGQDGGAVEILSSDEEEEEEEEEDGGDAAAEEQVDDYTLYLGAEDSGLRDLTDRQERRYDEAMRRGPELDTLAKHPVSGDELLRKDFMRVGPGEWLSDEVVNVYMKLLQQRDGRLRSLTARLRQEEPGGAAFPTCHFFPTFFYNKLYQDKGTYDYSGVQRWTRKPKLRAGFQESESILDCDLIFVPIHQPSHWTMAVVNMRERCLCYYDSLHGEDHRLLGHLAQYIRDEALDKRNETLDTSDWPRVFPKTVPRQRNGFDCGMFSVKFADYESRNRDFTFGQQDMPYFRRRLVAELMDMRAS